MSDKNFWIFFVLVLCFVRQNDILIFSEQRTQAKGETMTECDLNCDQRRRLAKLDVSFGDLQSELAWTIGSLWFIADGRPFSPAGFCGHGEIDGVRFPLSTILQDIEHKLLLVDPV